MIGQLPLSLIGAALFSLAFRPWGSGWFALGGAVVLVVVLMSEYAPLRGGLWVAIMWLGLGIPALEGAAAMLWWGFPALLAVLSLGWLAAGILFVLLRGRLRPEFSWLLLPVLFTAAEFLTAQTWLYGDAALALLAYTQTDTVLITLAPWSGASSVAAGVLLLATGIWSAFCRRWHHAAWLLIALVTALAVPTPGTSEEAATGHLTVGVVQGAQSDVDRLLAAYDQRVSRMLASVYKSLIRQAYSQGAELVVLGETVLPRRTDWLEPPVHIRSMLSAAPTVVVGSHEREDGRLFNSATVWTGARLESIYRKRALVPVVESSYTAGDSAQPVMLQAARAGFGICLDSLQAHLSRQSVLQGAEFLVFITDDAFAGYTASAHFHVRTAALRAAESGRTTVFANEWGPSEVFDRHGRSVGRFELGEQGVLVTSVTLSNGTTPFIALGDYVGWLTLVISFVAVLFRGRRGPQRPDDRITA